ncbi:hypothetical protein [Bacteroides thetaiotaomicron]|jgi:hypothetical protein|uniref:hypothetical protein n=1 Tax=Bacteroides thetaiotaomicron TaxID=818 RepID=UPI0018AC66B5|nr:hypothetical protein [Bacteroides thetaiotaomicron]MDC2250011.1 hypothetical protein [Bacteroides thetaiotaomicron]MDC2255216.1 hypothetical protein [Bacteroides thetaiotaomicron]MDC2269365.1 hypothetical protein [Bacteroides thetaiotaomicron]
MKITIAGIRYLGSLEKNVTALLGDDDRHLWARKATEPKLPKSEKFGWRNWRVYAEHYRH